MIHGMSVCCVCIHGMLSEPKAPQWPYPSADQLGTAGRTGQNGRPHYSLLKKAIGIWLHPDNFYRDEGFTHKLILASGCRHMPIN